MTDLRELKDEELASVTGGGSGVIPEGGITFETYATLLPGHYYSTSKDISEIAYVYECSEGLGYTSEKFMVDIPTNSWISRNKTPSGMKHIIYNVEGFMSRFPYRLNVQPQ